MDIFYAHARIFTNARDWNFRGCNKTIFRIAIHKHLKGVSDAKRTRHKLPWQQDFTEFLTIKIEAGLRLAQRGENISDA